MAKGGPPHQRIKVAGVGPGRARGPMAQKAPKRLVKKRGAAANPPPPPSSLSSHGGAATAERLLGG